jgi:hypothetical protein
MELNLSNIAITLSFDPTDLAELQRSGAAIPNFWQGHPIAPAQGGVLRFGDRQYAVLGRAWEHDGRMPVLRLYLTPSGVRTDTTLH